MYARIAAVSFLLAFASIAAGQPVGLTETPKPGDCSKFTVELTVNGNLIVTQDGKKQEIPLSAKAKHAFSEKTLAAADGLPSRSVRHYSEAVALTQIGGDKDQHTLPADRRLMVAARTPDGEFCFSLAGPITREELDLVAEHFDPHCLAGLLPGKAVAVGDTWNVSNEAAFTACLFDGLVKNALSGKFTGLEGGIATFTISGTADGIENGAKVSLKVEATGRFHVASGRVMELTWRQTDDREQGPASPASKLEAVVVLKREVLAAEPKELQIVVPAEPPAAAALLRFEDPKGRYRFDYPRQWHITGQTEDHLILRLLDGGELIAQATITAWKKAEPGKHATVEEFKKAVSESPGWMPTRNLEDGEVPLDGGRWLYRLLAEGKMEEQPAVQVFCMLAGPQGDQAAVTFALRPEKLKPLAGRDLQFVKAIEFPKK